jgi:hypothetical protein
LTSTICFSPATPSSVEPVVSLATSTLATHEKDAIEAALKDSKGRVAGPFGAAARLGVPASTLESKIKALKIDKRRFKAGESSGLAAALGIKAIRDPSRPFATNSRTGARSRIETAA